MFDPRYDVRVVEGDGVFLISEQGSHLLRGALYQRLAPLIDGNRTASAIVDALAGDTEPASVYYALHNLALKGYVVDAVVLLGDGSPAEREPVPPSAPVHPNAQKTRAGDPAQDEAGARIQVVSVDGLPLDAMSDALSRWGVGAGLACDFTLVLTADYLAPGLRDYNALSLRTGRPWLLLKPVGSVIWLGPLFRPGITACWECLAQRLRQHRPIETYLQEREADTTYRRKAAAASWPGIEQVVAGLAAQEVARAVRDRGPAPLDHVVITRDLLTGRTERHQLVRRPNCAGCGQPLRSDRTPRAPVFQSRRKRFVSDGGHRTVTPEETLDRFGHHVSPVTGIVSALAAQRFDAGGALHVYASGRNLAFAAPTLDRLRARARSGSSGKGMTDAQARASGLCEAIERYSAVFQGDEPRIRASYRALGDRAIHPARCMLFSGDQYANRAEWNARNRPANRIPEELDETALLEWTPVWSLTKDAIRYLPTSYCYLGYPNPPGEPRTCVPTSSGNAAGNTLEEACVQAVLELIERDAVALWWYSRARRPGVALETFADERVEQLRRVYADLNREVWVLDVTSDFGIPAFAALARRTDSAAEEIVFGFGAHLDAHIGVLRALSELNQGLAASIARERSGNSESTWDDREAQRWARTATLVSHPYLAPDETAARRRQEDYRPTATDDVRDDVLACQAALECRGLEMLVLDLTRPDVGVPVMKVIVPGLRPYVPRFAPGRLFDIPVGLGWIPARLAESQLNSVPMVP